MALFEFCDNPIVDDIIVETLDYDESIRITNEKLASTGKVVIAEAAFRYNQLFIRADIIVKHAVGKVIDRYEVKAKSWNSDVENQLSFILYLGKATEGINSKWPPIYMILHFKNM